MNRLKELRNEVGISLRELERYTGIGFSRLAVLEKTDANMEKSTLEKLAKFYQVSISFILGQQPSYRTFFNVVSQEYADYLFEDPNLSIGRDQYDVVINDDGRVQRILTIEKSKEINDHFNIQSHALERMANTERYIRSLDRLALDEAESAVEQINDYLSERRHKEALKK